MALETPPSRPPGARGDALSFVPDRLVLQREAVGKARFYALVTTSACGARRTLSSDRLPRTKTRGARGKAG
jgi:hypothetical protein